ncbi:uncharacterized protein [Amphiura filiformis]|uniref:uncharacterized protein n=1 Tax=Amphiura filiformis TaxID=82378 RepID=UPI003B215C4A
MSTVPIVTIAWQQPSKWIGVEEHVRRGRIRNRGELTTGMTVQVMYKKGWYKAKVINPDPLRARNRTKKSCTCCVSPVKHTHLTGKARKKGTRSQTSNSESDATVDGVSREDTNTDIDYRTEGDTALSTETDSQVEGNVKHSDVENVDQEKTEADSEKGVNEEGDAKDQRNVFTDMQVNENDDAEIGSGKKGDDAVMQSVEKQSNEGESMNAEVGKSDEMNIQGDGIKTHGEFKDDEQDLHDNNNDAESDGNDIKSNGEEAAQNAESRNVDSDKMIIEQEEDAEGERHIPNESYHREEEQILDKEATEQAPDGSVDEQSPEEQVTTDEATNESTTKDFAAREQIANEHMYSQRYLLLITG